MESSKEFAVLGKSMKLEELVGKNLSDLTYQRICVGLKTEAENRSPEKIELLNGRILAPVLSYNYIGRSLSYKAKLSKEVFDDDSTIDHVFLFGKGTNINEINEIVKYKPIDTSSNQLDNVNVTSNFILLEDKEDFDIISKTTSLPVHVVEFRNGTCFWIKSSGGVNTVEKFMENDGTEIHQTELIAKVTSGRVIIISGNPRTGKSWLLANLAKNMQKEGSTVTPFALHIHLPKLLEMRTSSPSTIQTIAAYASSNSGTELILKQMLMRGSFKFTLIIDGYDDIKESDMTSADQILKDIAVMKNMSVFITVRPSRKSHLQDILNVISHELNDFTHEETVDFFISYWFNQFNSTVKENPQLRNFAKEIVSLIDVMWQMSTKTEKQIAGKPFLNWMIAEICADEARKYSTSTASLSGISSKIYQAYDLYKQYFQLKFSKIDQDYRIRRKYLQALVHYSVRVLFPAWLGKLEKFMIGRDQVKESTMYSLGIIRRIQDNPNAMEFINRSFAQFLLAEFIAKNIGKCGGCIEFLLEEVIIPQSKKPNEDNLVMIYFIDKHLKDYLKHDYIDHSMVARCIGEIKLDKEELEQILGQSRTLLDFITKVVSIKEMGDSKEISFPKLEIPDYPWMYVLQSAVRDGKYEAVVTLLQHDFKGQEKQMMLLPHICVCDSNKNDDATIDNKFKILDILFQTNRDSLHHQVDEKGYTPLLQKNVHLKLLQKLVELGANINYVPFGRNFGDDVVLGRKTILHRSLEDKNLEIIPWAISKGFTFINYCDSNDMTPLLIAVSTGTLNDEMLELFHKLGANFNSYDNKGRSVLLYVMITGNSDFMDKIIKCGALVNARRSPSGNYLVHDIISCAVEEQWESKKLISILNLLLLKGFNHMNASNADRCTPLHLAMQLKYLDQKLLNFFVKCRANFNAIDYKGRSVLFYAIKHGKHDLIQNLLACGVDINRFDEDFGNLAHVIILEAVNEGWNSKKIENLLRLIISRGFHPRNLNRQKEIEETNIVVVGMKRGMERTPLHCAMQLPNIEPELVDFFHEYGADFKAVACDAYDVLRVAVQCKQNASIISKIVEYGGDIYWQRYPYYKTNSFFIAAGWGNQSALQYFIGKYRDVNDRDELGKTAMHYLFESSSEDNVEHVKSLKMLIEKGARFDLKDGSDYYALVNWILETIDSVDFLQAVVDNKKLLPITSLIASDALTAVTKNDTFLKIYLVNSTEKQKLAFTNFIDLLIEKGGKLLLKDGKCFTWDKLEKAQTREINKIKISNEFWLELIKRQGKFKNSKSKMPEMNNKSNFEILTQKDIRITGEAMFVHLLVRKNHEEFIKFCRILRDALKSFRLHSKLYK